MSADAVRAALLTLLERRGAGNWVVTDVLARVAGRGYHRRISELRAGGYAIENLRQGRGRNRVSFYRLAPGVARMIFKATFYRGRPTRGAKLIPIGSVIYRWDPSQRDVPPYIPFADGWSRKFHKIDRLVK